MSKQLDHNTTLLRNLGCPIFYADCYQSAGVGVLDIFDFFCFQNRFVTQNPYACYCNTSTVAAVRDVFDFLCLQKTFVAGYPQKAMELHHRNILAGR